MEIAAAVSPSERAGDQDAVDGEALVRSFAAMDPVQRLHFAWSSAGRTYSCAVGGLRRAGVTLLQLLVAHDAGVLQTRELWLQRLVDAEVQRGDGHGILCALASGSHLDAVDTTQRHFARLFGTWRDSVDGRGRTPLMLLCERNARVLNLGLPWADELLALH